MSNLIISKFPKKVNRKMKNDEDIRFAISIIALLLVVMGLAIVYIASKPAKQEEIFLKAEPIVTEQATEPVEIVEELSGGHETVEVETVEEISEVAELPVEEKKQPTLSDSELIAMVVNIEAGIEAEMIAKVAVASVVLNRCDAWGMTVESVIYQKDQFAIADSYTEEDMRAVEIAQKVRDLFPSNMLYFRNKHYHSFGVPYMEIGGNYFSLSESEEIE